MRQKLMIVLTCLVLAACSRETKQEASNTADKVSDAASGAVETAKEKLSDIAVPIGKRPTREEIEKERFNAEWQRLKSFQSARAVRAATAPLSTTAGGAQFVTVSGKQYGEKLKGINPAAVEKMPVRVPITGDVEGPSVLRTQVLLDRNNFSVGAIDGRWGKNSAIAVYWFQQARGLNTTGDVDEATYSALAQGAGTLPLLREHTVTAEDVKGPFTKIPEDVYEQEKLDCLCYENAFEALSERFHATSELLQALNPGLSPGSIAAGQKIWVPNVRQQRAENAGVDVQKIVVSVKGNYLHGYGADGRLLFHAPTTVGSKYDPSPDETVKLADIAHDPHFHYQPKLFHEVPDTDPEANLQPGPNSPVGVVWMALSKPHFGIHGTSDPDSIGYASSHGCVRLANWDARELSYRVSKGTQVAFVDTSHSEAAEAVSQPQSAGSQQ